MEVSVGQSVTPCTIIHLHIHVVKTNISIKDYGVFEISAHPQTPIRDLMEGLRRKMQFNTCPRCFVIQSLRDSKGAEYRVRRADNSYEWSDETVEQLGLRSGEYTAENNREDHDGSWIWA